MGTATEKPWYLVADIGGTNARFAVADYHTGTLLATRRYAVSEYAEFSGALQQFLRDVAEAGGCLPLPNSVCLAVACAVDGDRVQFTNSPWSIERLQVAEMLGGAAVELINDFAAVGYAVTDLKPGDWHQLGEGSPQAGAPIAVLGAGTGLGVCSLVPIGAGYRVVEGEGGHADFAPVDSQEMSILEILSSRFGRVSVERLLSGAGILNIYQALSQLENTHPVLQTPAEITAATQQGTDTLATRALEIFCRVLGATAGNLALTLGARGGVYIAGGVVPRFLNFIERSDFRHRFESKGRFRSYVSPIPTRVIVKDDLGLAGAVKKLTLSEL